MLRTSIVRWLGAYSVLVLSCVQQPSQPQRIHMRTKIPGTLVTTLAALAWSPQLAAQESPPRGGDGPALEAEVITVTAASDSNAGYSPATATAATKTSTPLMETPMSVQVITNEVWTDQQAMSLRDVVRNSSGVAPSDYSYYDFIQIRGFANGYAAHYRNGLQLQAITGLEMELLERVEVVKGPASMLYGRIEPGGLVNLVTKKPQQEAAISLQQQAGSFGLLKTTADATGPITSDGSLSYRAIGTWTRADSFLDHVRSENRVGALYTTWRPTERFDLNLGYEHQDNRFMDTEDLGIPIIGNRPADVARNTYLGDPVAWDIPNHPVRDLYAFDWTLALGGSWNLTQRFHLDRRDEQQFTFWNNGFDANTGIQDRGLWYVQVVRETIASNLDLVGDLSMAGTRHRVLVGVDYFRFTSQWHGFSGTDPVIGSIDIYAPSYGLDASAIRDLPENFFYDTRDEWMGIYFQDQVSLGEHWEVLLGARFDSATYGNGESSTSLADASDNLDATTDRALSPRAGLLYKLGTGLSFYGSYTSSFGSNNARSASGDPLDPETALQYEAGAKASLLEGAITATTAVFHLEKNNILTDDLSTSDPDDQTTIGQSTNRGIEFDFSGQITRHVNIITSYTYSHAKITKDNSGNEGNEMPNIPRHLASLWTTCDTAPGETSGWRMGGGVYAVGRRQGNEANTWQLPGYARVDAMLGYHAILGTTELQMQINVENLLDQSYFDRGNDGAGAKYGSPRSLLAELEVTF